MTDPIPPAAGIIATAGTEPESIVMQALDGARAQLVTYLGRPDVEKELAGGIFAFLNKQFPMVAGNPIVGGVEQFVLNLITARGAK
jgi:hypothetical protein